MKIGKKVVTKLVGEEVIEFLSKLGVVDFSSAKTIKEVHSDGKMAYYDYILGKKPITLSRRSPSIRLRSYDLRLVCLIQA